MIRYYIFLLSTFAYFSNSSEKYSLFDKLWNECISVFVLTKSSTATVYINFKHNSVLTFLNSWWLSSIKPFKNLVERWSQITDVKFFSKGTVFKQFISCLMSEICYGQISILHWTSIVLMSLIYSSSWRPCLLWVLTSHISGRNHIFWCIINNILNNLVEQYCQ
jgi:hypothetical protein